MIRDLMLSASDADRTTVLNAIIALLGKGNNAQDSALGAGLGMAAQALNATAKDRIDNFREVGHGHVTVKEVVGLDQDADAARALIEATAGADPRLHPGEAAGGQLFF